MKSNLFKRIITGVFLIIFVVGMIYLNNYVFTLGLLLFSNIAIYELGNALYKINYKTNKPFIYFFNSVILISTLFNNLNITLSLYIISFITIFSLIIFIDNYNINSLMSNVFLIIYITIPYLLLLNIKDTKWILYAYAIPSFTDTFAYIIGILFGRHKLIERLSPKKTIEGALGGILGGLIFTFAFINIFSLRQDIYLYGFAIIFSIFSQIGDLFASYIKRKAGIKDYGKILIGHGGVMDRFDSLLLVAPLVYIMIINLRL